MTQAEHMAEVKAMLDEVLDRWAPDKSESYDNRMMRALLQLHAFEKDLDLVRAGEQPIRTFYPIALQ